MDKREEIIISASKVFYSNGYIKTKISDIAKEARMGKSTFYDYFQSKDEIFLKVIEYWTEISEGILASIVNSENTAEEKLSLIFFKGIEFLEKNGVNIKSTFQESYSICKISQCGFDKFYKIWYDSILKIMEDGIASGEFRGMNTWSMIYIFEGAIFSYFTDNYLRKMERNLQTNQLFNDIIKCYK